MNTQLGDRPKIDTSSRTAGLNVNDKAFHVVMSQQFDRASIEQLCQLADMIRTIGGSRAGTQFLRTQLSHRRAMLYFIIREMTRHHPTQFIRSFVDDVNQTSRGKGCEGVLYPLIRAAVDFAYMVRRENLRISPKTTVI